VILQELVKLSQKKVGRELTQFKSLVGANQYRKLYDLMSRWMPAKSRVLDWGSGNGHFSYFLCLAGYKTVGFSMEDFLLRPKLRKFGYKFYKGKISEPTKLPFKDNSFEGASSVGVLEHVREFGGNELKSLKEIRRILVPGGVFVCFHLPNYYSLTETLARAFTKKFIHEYRFKENDVRKLCKASGLELLEIGRYGILPRNSWVKFTVLGNFKIVVLIWNLMDEILSKLFSPICQNYYFVARKTKL